MPIKIACVHQGYELYGSDRCFVESVAAFRQAYPDADIEVVLPRPGPIVEWLEPLASRIVFEPIFVLRRKGFWRFVATAPLRLPAALLRAARRFARSDIVYINTSVVADYQIAARAFTRKALLHVHEIPTGAARNVLRALAMWSGARLIFNSRATQKVFAIPPRQPQEVIYNGLEVARQPDAITYDGSRPLRVLMIGRINGYKGQDILVAALGKLSPELRHRFEVRMVGGAFENTAIEDSLRASVRAAGLSEILTVEPFASDPAPLYRWADIVTVPSKLPEALGRTAIEAMAFGRPPIVSAAGGLVEVVVDDETGWQVPPGDADALSRKLVEVATQPERWREFGRNGRARYERLFSPGAIAEAMSAATGRCLEAQAVTSPSRPPLTSHAR